MSLDVTKNCRISAGKLQKALKHFSDRSFCERIRILQLYENMKMTQSLVLGVLMLLVACLNQVCFPFCDCIT